MRLVAFVLFCLFAGLATGLAGFSGFLIGFMHAERGYSSAPPLIAVFGLLMLIGLAAFWLIMPFCLLIKYRRTLGE
ncbi:MAG: hypothetical protein QUS33_11820 [Dehalococcoidia bacterium]|nr:hypothetical protein [Dehalococcoidia bacterium]